MKAAPLRYFVTPNAKIVFDCSRPLD